MGAAVQWKIESSSSFNSLTFNAVQHVRFTLCFSWWSNESLWLYATKHYSLMGTVTCNGESFRKKWKITYLNHWLPQKTCTLFNPMEDQSELFSILFKLRQTRTKGKKNAWMNFNLLDSLDSMSSFLHFCYSCWIAKVVKSLSSLTNDSK